MSEKSPPVIFRVRELELRYRPHRLDSPFQDTLSEPETAAKLAAHILRDSATEVVLMLHLNVKHRLIGMHRIPGAIDCVSMSLPEVLRIALLSNAKALIFVHNHLSGHPSPSADDREFVQRLRNITRVLGVDLLDALIVVDPAEGNQYFSFRKEGLL